ncbi:MAG: CDP-diacylglycerol--glycerol-3-phosphate 3-phosphatidyltransferase [Pseudomonadota bacterium]
MLNLPNYLTILRIMVIPFIVTFLFFPGKLAAFFAALLFSIAAITDLLDGYIARQQNAVTFLGKALDPLADKLLITATLIMLIPLGRVPAWMAVVIISREIAITGLRGVTAIEGILISASNLGKYKTIFQDTALISLLLHYEYLNVDLHTVGMFFLWVALIVTIWSGYDYFYRFFNKIKSIDG